MSVWATFVGNIRRFFGFLMGKRKIPLSHWDKTFGSHLNFHNFLELLLCACNLTNTYKVHLIFCINKQMNGKYSKWNSRVTIIVQGNTSRNENYDILLWKISFSFLCGAYCVVAWIMWWCHCVERTITKYYMKYVVLLLLERIRQRKNSIFIEYFFYGFSHQ